MKISVITPSYNQAAFLEQTIRSVLDQGIEGLEYIVIDGGSTDGALDILRSFEGRIKWISEPDEGLADAVNKGIRMATGEIIGWLNSDDLYHPGAFQRVIDYFEENPGCMWLYGKCSIIDTKGRERWKGVTWYKNISLKSFSYRRLLAENYISQPAVFFRKGLIKQAGLLDTSLRYAMDYDLWCRFGALYPAHVIPHYLAAFRRHQTSKSENDFREQFLEQYQVAKRYNPGKVLLALHRFNIFKIIWTYRLINLFQPAP